MKNTVAIIGRPNVGKSTFFNRLTKRQDAIVHESSGVTRDRHYGISDWNGKEFAVIDTGGYIEGSDDVFESEIRKQVQFALNETDFIVLMVDVTVGITNLDEEVVKILRKQEKPVFVVINKVDNHARLQEIHEFYKLGFEHLFPVSSINGSGTGDFLDFLVTHFKEDSIEPQQDIPYYAVVGRPNVGKSSLINSLIGNDRNIVTDVAGTTRDSVHTKTNIFGFEFMLVDTAGLRKKTKVHENIEFYSNLRTIRAIESADVCLMLIDAQSGFEAQDTNIFRLIQKNKKGVVILVNKWDLIEKDSNTHLAFENQVRSKIAPFTDVPVIFTSVLEKQRIFKAIETANHVYKNISRKISTSKLNDVMLPAIEKNPPPATSRGNYIKIKYVTQLPSKFPAFAFFTNFPEHVREAYRRYLENVIRQHFNFSGVPITIYFRKK